MKLIQIAKLVLSEDSWGNNPSAAAPQNPGIPPTTQSPKPSPSVKFYDVLKDYQAFQITIDSQEEAAKKDLNTTLTKALVNKEVTVRASKGAVGQVEKDYTLTVVSVSITYLKDKYYVILKGKDKKDYYINTGFKIKILSSGVEAKEETPEAPKASAQPNGKGQVGGIVYPQNMGIGSNRNVGA